MKTTDNYLKTIRQSLEYRRFYLFACFGFVLIGLTYLFREMLLQTTEGLAVILGIMPSLAGSFATPYLLLILVALQRSNQVVLRNSKLFYLINLFVLGMCILIEFLHLWLNLGGFHWNDIVASLVGILVALLAFHLVLAHKPTNPRLVSEP
jgi:hypothetical protein